MLKNIFPQSRYLSLANGISITPQLAFWDPCVMKRWQLSKMCFPKPFLQFQLGWTPSLETINLFIRVLRKPALACGITSNLVWSGCTHQSYWLLCLSNLWDVGKELEFAHLCVTCALNKVLEWWSTWVCSLTKILIKICQVVFNIKMGSKKHLFLGNLMRHLWKHKLPVCREATALWGFVALKKQALNMQSSWFWCDHRHPWRQVCAQGLCLFRAVLVLSEKNAFITEDLLLLKTCCSSSYREAVHCMLCEACGYGSEDTSSCGPETSVT